MVNRLNIMKNKKVYSVDINTCIEGEYDFCYYSYNHLEDAKRGIIEGLESDIRTILDLPDEFKLDEQINCEGEFNAGRDYIIKCMGDEIYKNRLEDFGLDEDCDGLDDFHIYINKNKTYASVNFEDNCTYIEYDINTMVIE